MSTKFTIAAFFMGALALSACSETMTRTSMGTSDAMGDGATISPADNDNSNVQELDGDPLE